jgi:chromate transporter
MGRRLGFYSAQLFNCGRPGRALRPFRRTFLDDGCFLWCQPGSYRAHPSFTHFWQWLVVIVPFLEKGLVQQTGWLNGREFLVAVAVGMLSPGPVVITATFVGYLVAGFWGSLIATVGIFLPSFLLILFVALILIRNRNNVYVQGFVKGAYGAVIGTILGTCVLLSKIAIGDRLTALIALGSLVVLFKWKVSNPLLVAITAAIGLIAFPLLQPP